MRLPRKCRPWLFANSFSSRQSGVDAAFSSGHSTITAASTVCRFIAQLSSQPINSSGSEGVLRKATTIKSASAVSLRAASAGDGSFSTFEPPRLDIPLHGFVRANRHAFQQRGGSRGKIEVIVNDRCFQRHFFRTFFMHYDGTHTTLPFSFRLHRHEERGIGSKKQKTFLGKIIWPGGKRQRRTSGPKQNGFQTSFTTPQ